MYGIKPVRHVRRCIRCPGKAITTGICGPVLICDACAEKLLAVIWGARWPAMKAHLDGHGRFTYPGAEVPAGRKKSRRTA